MLDRVQIYLIDGSAFAIRGEAIVDPVEHALIIKGEEEHSYVKFNWSKVLYYSVNAMEI